MLRSRASEIREAGDHPSRCSHQPGPVERMRWSRMRCGKVIPAQLLYLRRNHRNVERGSCKLFLAGVLPCLFCQAKPNAHTQISDEDRQHDQPECEGIEHGFEKESFNQPFRTYIQPWQSNMQYVEARLQPPHFWRRRLPRSRTLLAA